MSKDHINITYIYIHIDRYIDIDTEEIEREIHIYIYIVNIGSTSPIVGCRCRYIVIHTMILDFGSKAQHLIPASMVFVGSFYAYVVFCALVRRAALQ